MYLSVHSFFDSICVRAYIQEGINQEIIKYREVYMYRCMSYMCANMYIYGNMYILYVRVHNTFFFIPLVAHGCRCYIRLHFHATLSINSTTL